MKSVVASAVLVFLLGCGTKDEAAGAVVFTASAGSAVESATPVAAFADGWTVHYDRFLVTFQDLVMRNGEDAPAARLLGARLLDLKVPGPKRIVAFDSLAANTYTRVGYRIATITASTDVGAGATEDDRARMLAGGYGIYLEGSATNGATTKYFRWGFALNTTYDRCRTGAPVSGAVVAEGTTTEIGIVVDALRLFTDDPAAAPALRFAPFAAADTNGDQIIDVAELAGQPPLTAGRAGAANLLEDVQAAARTLGRFHDGGTCDPTLN